jgi:tripartite-type tricarboxylate transporter receptor subunit TctC
VAELIKLAKARPGELNCSSGPTGSSSNLAGKLFKSMAKADIMSIEYKAQPQQTVDSLSGQIQMTFGQGVTWAALIKAGKLRALATGGSRRSILFPELPTVAETLPGFVSESLLGLWAPAKTPDAIVRRLNQEIVRAFEKPDVRDRLLKNGQEPVGGSPAQLTDYVKSEVARVSKLIKDLGGKSGGS